MFVIIKLLKWSENLLCRFCFMLLSKVFTDEESGSDSDTDDPGPSVIPNREPIENTATEQMQENQQQYQTEQQETNSSIRSRCSEVSSPTSLDPQPVPAVEPWTIQGSDNMRMS